MVKVLGVPLYSENIPQAVNIVLGVCGAGERKSRCISATGAHGMVLARQDPEFASVLNRFYMNLPDGMPGVWVGRLKGVTQMERCYGPDFFRDLIVATGKTQIKHYFCGGKDGVADKLKEACRTKFGNTNVVGTFCPPFREMTDEELHALAAQIEAVKTDILWIGISTPKQERFAWRVAQVVKVEFIVTVGAAFDFHIGEVRQAPPLLQKFGLEWFFRLCMEPRRLYKRYLHIVPCFIFFSLKDLLQGK